MRSVFILLGGALIMIAMGVPTDFPVQSSAKSALPYLVYWLLSGLEDWGGRYAIVAFGVGLIALAFLIPSRKPKD